MAAAAYTIGEVLFNEHVIQTRVHELASDLGSMLMGKKDVVVVALLRGSFVFFADIIRELARDGLDMRIDFLTVGSYVGNVSSTLQLKHDIEIDIRGSTVMVVDDILDTGRSLSFACDHLRAKGAAEVHTCVLLDKPSRRTVPRQADFIGFTIDDVFVVGYGLDFDHRHRELPHIAAVRFPEDKQ
ncbi:MAG: hypoxanthine phosphoribosyltransferase [Spirochaetes bacterium]|nr:hypoxanthine phosphoribosyltransferase [Spirochaetota bacterium]